MATGSSRQSKLSCPCDVAKPFPGLNEEELSIEMEKVWQKFEPAYKFPSLNEDTIWEVNLLSRGIFSHYSLLLTVPERFREGLIIELYVINDSIAFKFSRKYLPKLHESLEKTPLGRTTKAMSADTIIREAHDLLKDMGPYHDLLNNCQKYCTKVAKFLGVSIPSTAFGFLLETALDTAIILTKIAMGQ